MTDEQRLQRIEAYLDKTMGEQERRIFEMEISTDENLRKEVLLQETIRLAFINKEEASLHSQMDELFDQNRYRFDKPLNTEDIDSEFLNEINYEVPQKIEEKPKMVLQPIYKKRRFLMAVAASLSLLAVIGWWWFASKPVTTDEKEIVTINDKNTEGGNQKPITIDKTPQKTEDIKQTPQPSPNKTKETEQTASLDNQSSTVIQQITSWATVEKNVSATVMGSSNNTDLYEAAVKQYIKNGDTKGFATYLNADNKADNYTNIKRLVHAHFRLKNYEKAIFYCQMGLKLTDLEADEKKELDLLLLESYFGDYSKYKSYIQKTSQTGSVEEKQLITTMQVKGFK